MFSIGIIEKNKSKKLYQWDLDRQIRITAPEGITVDEIHFARENDKDALVERTKDVEGKLVADIPNILLQRYGKIRVWLVSEDQTVFSDILIVIQRAKPADYVYTETEVLRYEDLEKRIKALEENGTERIQKTKDDTVVELEPNKLYVFPEMTALSYTLLSKDKSKLEEYHFIFRSGATPTEVTHPEGVKIGDFKVESNKIYEVSILEGLLLSQSWAVE